jgi:hypothetical protein
VSVHDSQGNWAKKHIAEVNILRLLLRTCCFPSFVYASPCIIMQGANMSHESTMSRNGEVSLPLTLSCTEHLPCRCPYATSTLDYNSSSIADCSVHAAGFGTDAVTGSPFRCARGTYSDGTVSAFDISNPQH